MDLYLNIQLAENYNTEFRVITNYKSIYDLALLVPKNIKEPELKEGSIIEFLYHKWEIKTAEYGTTPFNSYVCKIVK